MKTKNIIQIVIITVAFLLLYHEVVAHIFRSWSTPDGSHGPLLLAVSLFLVWINRKKLRDLQPEPSILPGAFLLAVGCFTFFAGKISSTLMVQLISVVPVLLGIILLLAGFSWFKVFLLPVGYLIFLTGFIERLLGNLAIYLQLFTAWLSVLLFELTGFQVFHEGTFIMLPHISLEVARGCSGISHIVSLLALSVPLAYLTQKTITRKIILVFSALIIGIFANGLRVFLIGVYTLYYPGVDIHGPAETLYVSFIFFFGLVVLIIFSKLLNGKAVKKDSTDTSASDQDLSSPSQPYNKHLLSSNVSISILIAGFIFTVTLGLVHFYNPQPVDLKHDLYLFTNQIAGFSSKDLDHIHDRLRPFPADNELIRLYKDEQGNTIELYIGYFKIQDRENKIIDYRRAWMHEQVSSVEVNGANTLPAINKTRLRQETSNSDIYFWYQMDGRIITNEYAGKFFTFMDSLLKRKNNAAIIIIKTSIPPKQVMPFLEEVLPLIRAHLSGSS